MLLILTTLAYMAVSALIPLFNAEAYLAGVAATVAADADPVKLWLLGLLAGVGQMIGKVLWYCAGRYALDWRWLKRRTSGARWQANVAKWQRRINDRWWLAALLLFASAVLGFPPFAVMSVLAGQLKVPVPVFVVTGLVGRTVRFGALLTGTHWLTGTGWWASLFH
jgi:membrane protein YqaA with SNARE-associated domain